MISKKYVNQGVRYGGGTNQDRLLSRSKISWSRWERSGGLNCAQNLL